MSVTVVLGRRGCGKTTNIKARLGDKSRLIIFDTLAEYGSCGKVFREPLPMVDYLERRQGTFFRCVYQPIEAEELREPFSYVMRAAWICGDCTLVLDEIDQVSSPASVPYELARNLRYGRHRGIAVIAASRRAAEVPRLITSQADEIVSFNQTEPNDVRYIEAFCGKEFAQKTMRLPRFQCLTYRPFEQALKPLVAKPPNGDSEDIEREDESDREEDESTTTNPLPTPSDSAIEDLASSPPGSGAGPR